jgi:phenylpropionate dioxygenase-like ring-hydroxylating dioxygenase large terminal subunit
MRANEATGAGASVIAGEPVRPQSERYPWTVFPAGWYAVAFSHELAKGGVLARRYFGRELVVFRSESGVAAVLDAYCPHMGAHLAHGSRVDQGALRCPMHGFRFDGGGACVSTPYAAKVPPAARAIAWAVVERNGAVLVWHDATGAPPAWEVPEVDGGGFNAPLYRSFRLPAHPQETTENAVDFGHLSEVHGYQEIELLRELSLDGATLSVRYAMSRPSPFGSGRPVRAEFEINAWGLGVSFVEVRVVGTSLHTHHFVYVTPIDGDECDLRALMRVDGTLRPSGVHWALGLLPRALSGPLVARLAFAGFLNDIQQDFRVWKHKRYSDPPALALGDGPVGRYRQWARQFYGAA